jgi:two-component system cell cycle sensor histidine kinase/response regulator CckA
VINLSEVVAGMDKMLRRLIGEDIDLVTRPSSELWKTKADPGQIEQVILNLAVNARDAMPEGGKLTIGTANIVLDETYPGSHLATQAGDYVMLAASDTGSGMTPEVRARIFEPFFTTKEPGKGTGLGLSTTYGIVKQSGGSIWVYSEPGHGTTFKIYLPRVADESARQRKEDAPQKDVSKGYETILLVEDDETVRTLVRKILAKSGYTVLEASSGNEALELSRQHSGPIQLMVTDVVMPGTNLRGFTETIAMLRPDTKVLYVSGYTDDAIVRHGVLEEGMHFVQKPFTAAVLERKVRSVLDGV